jgi:hypothetical protein
MLLSIGRGALPSGTRNRAYMAQTGCRASTSSRTTWKAEVMIIGAAYDVSSAPTAIGRTHSETSSQSRVRLLIILRKAQEKRTNVDENRLACCF